MAAPRKLLKKKGRQKLLISPAYLIMGVFLFAISLLGYNVSNLRKALTDQSAAPGSANGYTAPERAAKKEQAARNALQKSATNNNNDDEAADSAKKQVQNAAVAAGDDQEEEESYEATSDGVQYQIIFSTGCNAFQDWQSYMFFFHAAKALKNAKPPLSAMENTHVTRIASGCTPEDAELMKQVHKEQFEIMTPRKNFHLHLTPDFSHVHGGTKAYKYFNKPYGTKHWMEHALGYKKGEDDSHDNDIVILLDPDQIIMRPFTNDFSQHSEAMRPRKNLPQWDTITHGQPFAQQYGFHSQWYTKTNITAIAKKEELPSPLESMDRQIINQNFAAGPPYMATGRDFYRIADKWAEFGVGVHFQYPFLLAEMFAYCLAAAHLNLPHQIVQSFMVSDTGAGGMEGWKHSIDKYSETDVCTEGAISPEDLPNVLHYCQRYWLGKWFIGKYRLPKDFISCESPLLMLPPNDIALKYDFAIQPVTGEKKEMSKEHAKRNAFILCRFLPALNEAARFYKEHHCKDTPPNMQETLIFHASMTITEK